MKSTSWKLNSACRENGLREVLRASGRPAKHFFESIGQRQGTDTTSASRGIAGASGAVSGMAPGMVCRGTWHNLELSAGSDLRTDDRRAGANLGNTLSPRGRNASFLVWFPIFLQGPGFQSTRNLLGAHCRGLFVAPASAMISTQHFTAAICCLNRRFDAMRIQVER